MKSMKTKDEGSVEWTSSRGANCLSSLDSLSHLTFTPSSASPFTPSHLRSSLPPSLPSSTLHFALTVAVQPARAARLGSPSQSLKSQSPPVVGI
ncbi:hypothetical protein Csa_020082 [Cucumis sativus]|uniref:Uncharacterized protein n=1 Tax=Cucumis sativus TaxID=3659 RepID=A0A0A0LZ39_CUCSA|nr:hypothetical protein Csa_020082 [Cucumis sativus]